MQIIQFKENQREMWNKFIAENSSESFLQAWEWGEFQKNVGRRILRVGVISNNFKENNKEVSSIKYQVSSDNLLAVALLIKYELPFGQSYLYCPRGPVASQKFVKSKVYKAAVDFLFEEIKKITKKEKAMFLKIDPPMKLNQESRIKNQELEAPPLSKGVGGIFRKSPNEIQPKNTLILDITKSEEELLKEMKPKTRYNIRLAERKGVRIRNYESGIMNQEYFEKFWKLTEETSKRDKFAPHNKNYYWKMLESLDGKHTPSPSQEGDSLYCLQAKLYLAEYKNKTIAANIVLSFGDFCVYLHGASSSEYRNVMAPYLLQWRQILDAKKTGCKAYDFWGVSNLKATCRHVAFRFDKKSDWSGITRFKKGFGGKERNYIGAYDLVFSRWKYELYKFLKKIKNL